MNLKKRDPDILKVVIFEIGKNNGAALSDIEKNTGLNYQTVKNQVKFLRDLDLLIDGRVEKDIKRGKGFQHGDNINSVKFKSDMKILKEIGKILNNSKELSKFMETKYYQDNVNDYLKNLIDSMMQNNLYPLPDTNYLDYALRNSPSIVRLWLIENDINYLISFYNRSKWLVQRSDKWVEEIDYPVWNDAVFYQIQTDASNNTLLNCNNELASYSPFKKVMLISNRNE